MINTITPDYLLAAMASNRPLTYWWVKNNDFISWPATIWTHQERFSLQYRHRGWLRPDQLRRNRPGAPHIIPDMKRFAGNGLKRSVVFLPGKRGHKYISWSWMRIWPQEHLDMIDKTFRIYVKLGYDKKNHIQNSYIFKFSNSFIITRKFNA